MVLFTRHFGNSLFGALKGKSSVTNAKYGSNKLFPLKAEAARLQLGTAHHLWMNDLDPISTHILVCGGTEVAEALATSAGHQILSQFVEMDGIPKKELHTLRTKYWNALKHGTTVGGKELRDDEDLLSEDFASENEIRLFAGWFALLQTQTPIPIAAHFFIHWSLSKVATESMGITQLNEHFIGIRQLDPAKQKARLNRAIDEWQPNLAQRLELRGIIDLRPLIVSAH